ncbi:MAG: D-alanyl-D-alanine carboxypeptidase/D-alanyl-D-alanine-endopeptidase [Actinomycetota bacterium]
MTDTTTDVTPKGGPNYLVLGLAAALVTALSFAAGFFFGPGSTAAPVETAAPRSVPDSPLLAFPVRTCSIGAQVASTKLGDATVFVLNAETDETLFQFGANPTAPMASVMKVITAATALKVLGADARLTTRVVAGSAPGSVILIGGGDPTLSAGNGSVYSGAPSITDLAEQTVAAYQDTFPDADPITEVIVDVTMFPVDDAWHSSWPKSERTEGYQPLIVPLMVDGDRANPNKATSPRSKNPVAKAAQVFADALQAAGAGDGESDITISYGAAPSNATKLASVSSQPVSKLIKQMLPNSDNTLAELLLRAVSVKLGLGGTASSLQGAIVSTMTTLDVDLSDGTFIDGSGESLNIRINPGALAKLLDTIFSDAGDLALIAGSLPVAGESGTLSSRFDGDASVARGHVTAKTGWINGVYALAGKIDAADGSTLIAVVVASGDVGESAKAAIDNVFAAAYTCGNNLASY